MSARPASDPAVLAELTSAEGMPFEVVEAPEESARMPRSLRDRVAELAARADGPETATPRDLPAPAPSPRSTRQPSFIVARLLAERGFWSLTPALQQEFAVDDLRGTLEVIPSQRGLSGGRERIVFHGLVSLWAEGPRDLPEVTTSFHALAQRLGWSWGGRTSADIASALELLTLTGYKFVGEAEPGPFSDMFTLVQRVITWKGPARSSNRHVRIVFNEAIFDYLSDRSVIRRLDYGAVSQIKPQQQLAQALLFFLDAQPGHRAQSGDRIERIERLVDGRLAATLGVKPVLKEFHRLLRAACATVENASARYEQVTMEPRRAQRFARNEPRYLLVAVRNRMIKLP